MTSMITNSSVLLDCYDAAESIPFVLFGAIGMFVLLWALMYFSMTENLKASATYFSTYVSNMCYVLGLFDGIIGGIFTCLAVTNMLRCRGIDIIDSEALGSIAASVTSSVISMMIIRWALLRLAVMRDYIWGGFVGFARWNSDDNNMVGWVKLFEWDCNWVCEEV